MTHIDVLGPNTPFFSPGEKAILKDAGGVPLVSDAAREFIFQRVIDTTIDRMVQRFQQLGGVLVQNYTRFSNHPTPIGRLVTPLTSLLTAESDMHFMAGISQEDKDRIVQLERIQIAVTAPAVREHSDPEDALEHGARQTLTVVSYENDGNGVWSPSSLPHMQTSHDEHTQFVAMLHSNLGRSKLID